MYNNPKRGEEGYLSDTILDEVLLNCDYSPSSETHDHAVSSSLDNRKRQNETMLYEEQDDIISNEVNSRIVTVLESTLPNRKKFKSHHACTYHQQGEEIQERGHSHPTVPPTQYSMIPSSASLIGNSGSSHDENNGQDTSLHDSSFFWEDEALCTNDTAASAALTEGTKGCEPKEKMVIKRPYTFEERLEQLKAFKVKHGHCDVETKTGDDKPLGRWCSQVKHSMKTIKNNQAPVVTGLSEDNFFQTSRRHWICNQETFRIGETLRRTQSLQGKARTLQRENQAVISLLGIGALR